jgi:3-oxoisoapionate kinase
MKSLPTDTPLFSYYGDDFTGSTDALEALATRGVLTVLFLGIPTDEVLSQFRACRAIGLAGPSRSRSPQWMSEHLPLAFRWLRSQRAAVCQYKVCSTFDSAPEVGSIGRALEIGQDVFGTSWTPVVAGAPHLGRYVAFSNLFAASGDEIYRIDRHPTMSRHPITPMDEGDLRIYLGRQTSRPISAIDLTMLASAEAEARLRQFAAGAVIFDGVDHGSMRESARLIWDLGASFVVGSSGFTHALMDHWRLAGLLPPAPPVSAPPAVDRLVAISGSCSPVTERQIRTVLRNGFAGIRLNPAEMDISPAVCQALGHLQDGRSVLLYSALGGEGVNSGVDREQLAIRMGDLLRDVLRRSGVKRGVVAGGDTASHAGRRLGVHALTFAAAVTPGAPLCHAHTEDRELQGIELVFKGGQVGRDDFFESVLGGRS